MLLDKKLLAMRIKKKVRDLRIKILFFTSDRFTTQRNVTEVRRRVHVICRRLCGKLKRNIVKEMIFIE